MSTLDFNEIKNKKEGLVTVNEILKLVDEDKDGMELVVVVSLCKDGDVNVYSSKAKNTYEVLGVLDSGKKLLQDLIFD